MEKSQHTESVQQVGSSLSGLTAVHEQLEEKYRGVNPDEVQIAPDALSLMTFNGYYSLNCAPGAFFCHRYKCAFSKWLIRSDL